MPLFVLQARQLTSDMPLVAGLALAMAGLAATPGRPKACAGGANLLVAGVGLLIGLLSGGALLGVALPCLAFSFAILAGWGLRPRPADDPAASKLTSPGWGAHLPAGTSLGTSLRSPGVQGGVALLVAALLGALLVLLTMTKANVAGQYSLLLGGVPRGGAPSVTFDTSFGSSASACSPGALWPSLRWPAAHRLGGGDESDGDRTGLWPTLSPHLRGVRLPPFPRCSCSCAAKRASAPWRQWRWLSVPCSTEALEGDRTEPVLDCWWRPGPC